VTLFTRCGTGKTERKLFGLGGLGFQGEGHLYLPLGRLLLVRFLAGQENEQHPVKKCSEIYSSSMGDKAPPCIRRLEAHFPGEKEKQKTADFFRAWKRAAFV